MSKKFTKGQYGSLFGLFKEAKLSYPNPPHKHVEQIKAWADGAVIQYKLINKWYTLETEPRWAVDTVYRVAPTLDEQAIINLEEMLRIAELAHKSSGSLVTELIHEITNLKSGE